MSAEIGEHKKEHDYRIRSLNSYFPIFDSDKLWSFKEENFLLAYIEQYGFGNWDEIEKNFETRNAKECMEHYFAYYIYGNIGKCKLTYLIEIN
jgi:transcriptional adapter 2-beta